MVILATATYQKSSLSWQFRKLTQRAQEWIALKLGNWEPDGPDLLPPDWLFSHRWVEGLFWLIVGLAVIGCAWQMYRLLAGSGIWDWMNRFIGQSFPRSEPQPPQAIGDWLHAAQTFQQAGNYPEACRALYMAMILRLNETQLIPDDRSRTDGEYTRLVAQLPLAENYQTLLQTHEELTFSQATISADRFQRCQRAYIAIEQGLSQDLNQGMNQA